MLLIFAMLFILPEDLMSSGNYGLIGNKLKIDNYKSITYYPYKIFLNENVSTLLKDEFYTFWEQIEILSNEEIPPGLCFTDEYVLISSYSDIDKRLGKVKIFDKNSGMCLLTLCLDSDSHLGGITFDGEYIWICNSFCHLVTSYHTLSTYISNTKIFNRISAFSSTL